MCIECHNILQISKHSFQISKYFLSASLSHLSVVVSGFLKTKLIILDILLEYQ
jgi:hypothetical protein